ncbi:uncharacterized protein FIBRA_01010 [Fibroporia radiculosa]|uniref:Pentacotripeptide-repeat region of PRORP domain-containing protein n=1 Tax=Fibroporia radiculosa TaxID=599839 RepID=J4HSL7_9APHY|nr:uncharacterized protein FIBRA_01010 [Fibroporia radiculosa]CCL99002.1 predicted protein [Fibroporia radiculosa]
MLPKVANHLLHHTARAVAAAQNQTGHTIRNVLQLQSSSGTSSSNSGRSSYGAGSGGPKYSSGRTYTGYSGAGRAVTQAESITSNDATYGGEDELEETSSEIPKAPSLAQKKGIFLHAPVRGKETLTVLKKVQSTIRSQHAFAARAGGDDTLVDLFPPSSLPPPSNVLAIDEKSFEENAPSLVSSTPPKSAEKDAAEQEVFKVINDAEATGDRSRVLEAVEGLRSQSRLLSAAGYNAALRAVSSVRQPGEDLRVILGLYNDMLHRSILPNFRTYINLITAFTDRDVEVQGVIRVIELRIKKRSAFGRADSSANAVDQKRLAALRAESNFRSAMTLFQSACAVPANAPSMEIYAALLRSCALHANVDAAVRVFAHLERRSDVLPSPQIFDYLISAYSNVGDLHGAKEVFEEFKESCRSNRISSFKPSGIPKVDKTLATKARMSRINVWNRMIKAYILGGQHTLAIGLLEQMLDTKAGDALKVADIPPPSASTFGQIIRGFCDVGEVDTALSWFDRLLEQDVPPRSPWEASVTPARPDRAMYVKLIDSLAVLGRIDDMNRVFSQFLERAPQDSLQVTEYERRTVSQANYYLRPQANAESDEDYTPATSDIAAETAADDHRLVQVPADYDATVIGQTIDQCLFPPNNANAHQAYDRFNNARQKGQYPHTGVMARLIGYLGREGEVMKIRDVYQAAQTLLATMEYDKEGQSAGWFQIEDSMIIGLAHAGDVDAAHVHRVRIMDHGGMPTADAYGALIHHVKDTTDDASNAMALWQEAQAGAVRPNIYLYNTIISKLAKARRADDALALFHEMKHNQGLAPSSVTYGALIAACCRVGDASSAERLFDEMSQQSNFKPRIPPYNTMMQLYTHTKPDRARVLHYYEALLNANVKPTAHTYKLLLDAYGTIEPIDNQAAEAVFERVTSGSRPLVQGTHWASLINSWGCAQKNLERALAIFDSIASHPSTRRSGTVLPDAVIFEALINVLVTHRRTDIIPQYMQRLESHGVHMTAYIANLLIKGYAAVGDIERSREIFESLADPPEGVAAPHNHAPHDNEAAAAPVPTNALVYREPSTWEAMVRAELGNANRDEAIALLQRLQARKFPPAVYNRISGIMLDDSVSPWATPSASP